MRSCRGQLIPACHGTIQQACGVVQKVPFPARANSQTTCYNREQGRKVGCCGVNKRERSQTPGMMRVDATKGDAEMLLKRIAATIIAFGICIGVMAVQLCRFKKPRLHACCIPLSLDTSKNSN